MCHTMDFKWYFQMSSQICSIKLNEWALKFEFRKSEKILPRDSSTDDILKILDIFLEN